ncbi:MAG TPA: BNR repeat-containing protein [Candidatus Anammoximicrobium sp.]|nr:BNR repeat-containing protein [Candidatus Anammoximicrobium sp.]
MPRPTWIFCQIVLLWSVSTCLAADAEPPSSWRVVQTIPVDSEVWRWNWASWDQDKIATVGDFQYTVFWDADRVFVLARRDLRDQRVQTVRLPGLKLTSDDAHRNTCLGISLQDGRLHLSWDHHNDPLRYTRSRAGFLTDPPPQISPDDIEPPQPIGTPAVSTSRATYPRFISDAKGQLFLFYRQGGSGNGENYLFRYDARSGTWTMIGKVFSSRGTYAPWDGDTTRNAYFHDLLFDANNRLHATWVYREIGASWASNHDLHYAYSDDEGQTWCNNAGQRIADLAAGDPIELADPGIVVREIPVYSWIMNAGCMALDSKNRPHVVTYKVPTPQRPEKLEHNPPPEIASQLRVVHYWRADDGRWLGGEPIAAGADYGRVARGDIVLDEKDTLFFFYQPKEAKGGFVCLEAHADNQWQQWRSYLLAGPEIAGMDASKHDRRRWDADRILSITAKAGQTGFAIVDLQLKQP